MTPLWGGPQSPACIPGGNLTPGPGTHEAAPGGADGRGSTQPGELQLDRVAQEMPAELPLEGSRAPASLLDGGTGDSPGASTPPTALGSLLPIPRLSDSLCWTPCPGDPPALGRHPALGAPCSLSRSTCLPVYLYLSICLSVCFSVYLLVCLCIYLLACLPVCFLSTCLSIYLPICPSVCLSVYLSSYLPTYLLAYLVTWLPTYLHAYLSSCPSVYLPAHLPIYLLIYLPTHLSVYLPTCLSTSPSLSIHPPWTLALGLLHTVLQGAKGAQGADASSVETFHFLSFPPRGGSAGSRGNSIFNRIHFNRIFEDVHACSGVPAWVPVTTGSARGVLPPHVLAHACDFLSFGRQAFGREWGGVSLWVGLVSPC